MQLTLLLEEQQLTERLLLRDSSNFSWHARDAEASVEAEPLILILKPTITHAPHKSRKWNV